MDGPASRLVDDRRVAPRTVILALPRLAAAAARRALDTTPELVVVAETARPAELAGLVDRLDPDCLLVDGSDAAFELAGAAILARRARLRVVALDGFGERASVSTLSPTTRPLSGTAASVLDALTTDGPPADRPTPATT